MLQARDARWNQQVPFSGELTVQAWGKGREWEHRQASALWSQCRGRGRNVASTVCPWQPHSAIPSKCSINSCILTCNSSLWCQERTLFFSELRFLGLRSYSQLLLLLNALFSLPFYPINYALEKVTEICFYFISARIFLQKSFMG